MRSCARTWTATWRTPRAYITDSCQASGDHELGIRHSDQASPRDAKAAIEHDADGVWIKPVLFDQDSRRQPIDRVVVAHRHGGLEHDWSAIEFAGDDMHGHARDLDAVIECLTLSIDPGKRR